MFFLFYFINFIYVIVLVSVLPSKSVMSQLLCLGFSPVGISGCEWMLSLRRENKGVVLGQIDMLSGLARWFVKWKKKII